MLKSKKIIISIVILLIISTFAQSNVFAANVSLNIKECKQEETNWCWDASTLCIARYLNKCKFSQSDLCRLIFGRVVNNGATKDEEMMAFAACGLTAQYFDTPVTTTQLRTMIVGWYSPTKAVISWNDNPSWWHDIVIFNWSDSSASSPNVAYMDPAQGDGTWNYCTYNELKHNDRFTWIHTYGYITTDKNQYLKKH